MTVASIGAVEVEKASRGEDCLGNGHIDWEERETVAAMAPRRGQDGGSVELLLMLRGSGQE